MANNNRQIKQSLHHIQRNYLESRLDRVVKLTEKEFLFSDYSRLFKRNVETGLNVSDAAIKVAEVYLDGKPARRGKHKISSAERDAAFWSCDFLITLPGETWQTEPFVLALARYVSQEPVSNMPLLEHIAMVDPESVRRAIRYSGLVLRQDSPRRVEIDRLATKAPEKFGEFVCILEVFDRAYRERQAEVDRLKRPLSGLTPLELMVYASLYAFEFLVPRDLLSTDPPIDPDNSTDSVWEAINDLLIWKLGSSREKAFRLSEKDIGRSLAIHLSPFLFPSPSGRRPREDLDEAFR